MSTVPPLCWAYRLSRIEKYHQTGMIYYCVVKKEKTCLLTDMATPDDSNVNTEETEKRSQYKDLEITISRMWKLRT